MIIDENTCNRWSMLHRLPYNNRIISRWSFCVVVFDNLCNSFEIALQRLEKITGVPITFYKADIRDKQALNAILDTYSIDACIHFAGLKAVGESVAKPHEYYDNNITGTLNLIDALRSHNIKNIIFSSSATVYGEPQTIPITEDCPNGSVPIHTAGQSG